MVALAPKAAARVAMPAISAAEPSKSETMTRKESGAGTPSEAKKPMVPSKP